MGSQLKSRSYKVYDVTRVEMQEILDFVKQWRAPVYERYNNLLHGPVGLRAYIYRSERGDYLEVVVAKQVGKKPKTYRTSLGKNDDVETPYIPQITKTLNKYYRVPDMTKIYGDNLKNTMKCASPFFYFNKDEDKNNHRHDNCLGYDLNSAYAYYMTLSMPDTSIPARKNDFVGENEVGFSRALNGRLVVKTAGHLAEFIFPLIPSPFVDYVNEYYELKRLAKQTGNDKMYNKFKAYLNIPTGCFCNTNPFIRAMIMYHSGTLMRGIIKKYPNNVLYSNTDSIISNIRIPELDEKIGDELGQWKIEHEGKFAYRDSIYQWNNDKPNWKGVAKYKFGDEDYDLLEDDLSSLTHVAPYEFNYKTLEIEKNDEIY